MLHKYLIHADVLLRFVHFAGWVEVFFFALFSFFCCCLGLPLWTSTNIWYWKIFSFVVHRLFVVSFIAIVDHLIHPTASSSTGLFTVFSSTSCLIPRLLAFLRFFISLVSMALLDSRLGVDKISFLYDAFPQNLLISNRLLFSWNLCAHFLRYKVIRKAHRFFVLREPCLNESVKHLTLFAAF